MKNPHIALSLGRDLWEDLLRTALPVEIAQGEFDVASGARGALRQLGVRQRVAGLLEDSSTPAPVRSLGNRARSAWRSRKPAVKRQLRDMVEVQGTYRVEVSESGTEFGYGRQRIHADAFVRGVAEGTVSLARHNIEIPFHLERQIGAAVTLGDIHYDRQKRAVIGSLGDLALHLGDHAVFQLVARIGERLLEQQLPRVNPVPILRRDQVEEMVGGLGGALNTKMGVDELELVITDEELSLQVRFGFSQAQLEDGEQE